MRIFLLGAAPSLSQVRVSPGAANDQIDPSLDRLNRTGGNIGNQIIAYGLLQALEYSTVSWDHSIGPERVNSEFDIIVIAAANFLHSAFDFSGMAVFIEATFLPCIMIGVGAQSNDYSTDIKLLPGTERLMRIVSERSKLIGARGPFTKAVLGKLGIHNVQITGCPSHYMNGPSPIEVRKPPLGSHPKLLFNSSRDVVSHSFDRDKMIEVVCSLLSIAVKNDADFVPQSELPEIKIGEANDRSSIDHNLKQLLQQFPFYKAVAPYEILLAWFSKHVRVFWEVAAWFEAMKQYDFVFGNRFHGNMIALQAGTPACVICHDTRTSEMCEFLGLPNCKLSELETLDYKGLYDRVDTQAIKERYMELYPQYAWFLMENGLHIRSNNRSTDHP